MNGWSDQQLLYEYATHGTHAGFGVLVRRHLDWIHSAAVRKVVYKLLAEDVTQGVLIALSRHAQELCDRTVLAGWLHRTTRNLAAKAVRTEVRRRSHEEEAARMHDTEDQSAWEDLAPQLDDALDQLEKADRDVLALRFFERRSAREIGVAMKLSEEAAQKRRSRALQRLRAFFCGSWIGATVTVSKPSSADIGKEKVRGVSTQGELVALMLPAENAEDGSKEWHPKKVFFTSD